MKSDNYSSLYDSIRIDAFGKDTIDTGVTTASYTNTAVNAGTEADKSAYSHLGNPSFFSEGKQNLVCTIVIVNLNFCNYVKCCNLCSVDPEGMSSKYRKLYKPRKALI